MELDDWKTLSEIISNAATTAALVVAGFWALWRFGIQREAHAKIEFELEVNLLGAQESSLIVEVVAKVTNKGRVRHWLKNFMFDLLYLPSGAPAVLGDERINYQVLFQPVVKKLYWIPPDWMGTFIDPGVTQRYTYLAAVPLDAKYLCVFARFKYPDARSDFHVAQRAWSVDQLASGDSISDNPTPRVGESD